MLGIRDSNIKIPISGLVFHIDAAQLRSYGGSGTDWTDIATSTTRTGSLVNGAAYTSSAGGAISFDGANDYATFGDILDQGTSDFTIGAWVKVQATASIQFIVAKRENAGAFNGYELRLSNTGIPTMILDGATSAPNRFATTSITTNTWRHVTGVYNISGNALNIYIDGTLNNGTSAGNPNTAGSVDNAIDFQLGRRQDGFQLKGFISSVVVYNRAITATEVLTLYNATKTRYV